MDWTRKLHEPFFLTTEDVDTYVTQEIQAALPPSWKFRRSGQSLSWIIRKESDSNLDEDYCVRVSNSLELVILTYGNTDAGPFGMRQALQTALVIDAVLLRAFSLSQCLTRLFTQCKPNLMGCT